MDPTAELSFIPSLDEDFPSLLGLEKVVQLRLELLDKFKYNVNKRRKGKAKKKNKKSPTSAVEPCTPPKDPLICSQCSTDFSCSWRQGVKGSILCQSCFKCRWKKPGNSAFSLTSGNLNSHIHSPFSHPVTNNPEVQQEAALPSDSSNAHNSDQKVPRISVSHIMSPGNNSSSPLSSPRFYSDPSSSPPAPSSSDPLSPFIYCSSPFYISPLSNGSSSPYYPSSSEFNSSSSSLSPSPPHCSKGSRKKAGAPYRMDTLLAKSLLKEGKVKEETKEDENKGLTWNSPLQSKENTEMTPISKSLPVASHSLSALTMKLGPTASTSVFSAGKEKAKTEMVKPTLKKTSKRKHASQTVHPELKPNQSKLQKASSNIPTLGLKQHNQQRTQVCNTGFVMMTSMEYTPVLDDNKQKKEKLKPCLKKATKEEHPSQTMHEKLKLDQGKLPKFSCDFLSMGWQQHNVQNTQICNTASLIMASTTSTPVLNASKQKTEKIMSSLKKPTKKEHHSQTMHETLKQKQSKLQKASTNCKRPPTNFYTDKTSGSPSASSHSAKFKEHCTAIRPKQTSIKLSFGNALSAVPSSSTQPVNKDPQTKQTKLAYLSVSPSHSAKSSQYLPNFSVHHMPSYRAATSKTFSDSVEVRQQSPWSRPKCVSECKPDPLIRSSPTKASSTQQGKTCQQAVVP